MRFLAFVAPIEDEEGSNAWKDWSVDELLDASQEVEQEIELILDGAMDSSGIASWTINGERLIEHEFSSNPFKYFDHKSYKKRMYTFGKMEYE